MMKATYLVPALLLAIAGCNFSDDLDNNVVVGANNATDNNGTNNETNNNTGTDNASTNNTSTNNATNNTSTNNATNNTSTNNATNNTSTNNTTPAAVWSPPPGTTWQWQIDGTIDTSIDVEMYDIDLFDAPQAVIDELHAAGRTVICYFSAGTFEDWRPDAGEYTPADYGNVLPDWPGEYYVDLNSANVRAIIAARLDLAAQKNCDGVEPDNVDTWDAASGFSHTISDQLDFNRFLADAAHERGLSVGLKNALGLVRDLEPHFDWALNEECLDYDECQDLQPFLDAGKAVFHTEYVDDPTMGAEKQRLVCNNATRPAEFSTLIKTWDLDAWYLACE